MKVDIRKPRHWVLLLQQSVYTLVAIVLRRLGRRPDKPLVVLYGHQLSGNLKALYREWSSAGEAGLDLYFLSLDPEYSLKLKREGIRVLQCNKLADMLKLGQAFALVSDHGLHMMTPLVRFTDIVFIDVWHGIPFKGFTPRDFSLQRRYDEVWVSSPLLQQIYEEKFGFEAGKVHSLGYARTDKLFNRAHPDPSFRDIANLPPGHRIVLYAPTWKQDDSGRELFPFDQEEESFIESLSAVCCAHDAILVIRSHLNAHIHERNFRNVIYCSQREFADTEDLLLESDILICDWSSIAFDFLALDRPTIFLDVEPPFNNGLTLGKEYRFGKIVGDMAALCDALRHSLECSNSYRLDQGSVHRSVTAEVYGGNTDGQVARRQLARLLSLAHLPSG